MRKNDKNHRKKSFGTNGAPPRLTGYVTAEQKAEWDAKVREAGKIDRIKNLDNGSIFVLLSEALPSFDRRTMAMIADYARDLAPPK